MIMVKDERSFIPIKKRMRDTCYQRKPKYVELEKDERSFIPIKKRMRDTCYQRKPKYVELEIS